MKTTYEKDESTGRFRARIFTKSGDEFSFTGESREEAEGKAGAFKRGLDAGARAAAHAALAAIE